MELYNQKPRKKKNCNPKNFFNSAIQQTPIYEKVKKMVHSLEKDIS